MLIFYTSRCFGLAPFLVRRTPKGRIADTVFSVLLCAYSVIALLAMGELVVMESRPPALSLRTTLVIIELFAPSALLVLVP